MVIGERERERKREKKKRSKEGGTCEENITLFMQLPHPKYVQILYQFTHDTSIVLLSNDSVVLSFDEYFWI